MTDLLSHLCHITNGLWQIKPLDGMTNVTKKTLASPPSFDTYDKVYYISKFLNLFEPVLKLNELKLILRLTFYNIFLELIVFAFII